MALDHSAITPTAIETTTPWQKRMNELTLYKNTHGHLNVVPSSDDNDDNDNYRELSQWIGRIRSRHRLGKLPRRKIQQLTNMGFSWNNNDTNNNDTSQERQKRQKNREWKRHFRHLVRFQQTHGHVDVTSKDDPSLKLWIDEQRHEYDNLRKGLKTTLTLGRRRQLEGLLIDFDDDRGSDDLWDARLEELRQFKTRHGHCSVESSSNVDDPVERRQQYAILARWLSRQRIEYRLFHRAVEKNQSSPQSLLTCHRIALLEELGVVSSEKNPLSKRRRRWDDRYEELKVYKTCHGDCLVPLSYEKYPLLGGWVRRQRHCYRQRQQRQQQQQQTTGGGGDVVKCPLTDERIELLNQLGFEWSSSSCPPNVANWDRRYNQLRRFKIKHGHCRIPPNEKKALVNWMNRQRRQYHRMKQRRKDGNDDATMVKRNQLTEERIARLDALGFIWSDDDDDNNKHKSSTTEGPWRQRYEELKIYKERHGDCMVPKHYGPNKKLGHWVSTQRDMFVRKQEGKKSSTMTEERKRLLDDLGFTWRAHGSAQTHSRWNTRINQLLQFHAQHGHFLIPKHYPPNPSLGKWVSNQRHNYARLRRGEPVSNLTAERARQLTDMGFEWNVTKIQKDSRDRWNARIDQLKEFKSRHGHLLVPGIYPPNPPLGKWVANQRRQYKKRKQQQQQQQIGNNKGSTTTLTQERYDELEELGFVWEVVTTDVIVDDVGSGGAGDGGTTVDANGGRMSLSQQRPGSAWGKRLIQLKDYKKEHGNVDVPRNYQPVKGLGAWVNRQRCHYRTFLLQNKNVGTTTKKCGMTEERVRLLDELGFVWDKRRKKKSTKSGEMVMDDVTKEEVETTTTTTTTTTAEVAGIDVMEMTIQGLVESDGYRGRGQTNDDDDDDCFPSMMDVQKALV